MGMVERVARALCRADGREPDTVYPSNRARYGATAVHACAIPAWMDYRDDARAAIEAMREGAAMGGKNKRALSRAQLDAGYSAYCKWREDDRAGWDDLIVAIISAVEAAGLVPGDAPGRRAPMSKPARSVRR